MKSNRRHEQIKIPVIKSENTKDWRIINTISETINDVQAGNEISVPSFIYVEKLGTMKAYNSF